MALFRKGYIIMDKLIGVIVICGLVLVLYLGVFQGSLGGAIMDKGQEVENVITGTSD